MSESKDLALRLLSSSRTLDAKPVAWPLDLRSGEVATYWQNLLRFSINVDLPNPTGYAHVCTANGAVTKGCL